VATPALAVGALDKAKEGGQLAMGYLTDAGPFASADASGKASGYAIDICNRIADAVKSELKLGSLNVSYVALNRDEAFTAVQQGKVDLLCGAVPTLARRAQVDFSIPIMISGVGVAVRPGAPARLRQALAGTDTSANRPTWRASTDQAPQRGVIGVVGGSTIEKALSDRLKERRIVADVVAVDTTVAGIQMLGEGKIDALVGDHAALLVAAARGEGAGQVVEARRAFVALAVRRDDDDFRLFVDRTLSRFYQTPDLAALYTKYFRAPSAGVLDIFKVVALPE
jgi:ABC-type amino acid transport substrate-binding protein